VRLFLAHAATYIVQLAHLSQELIEHTIQARNQLARAQYELDRIHQVTKLIVDVHENLGKDLGYAQFFK
jgi:hypothetical protein